ncbi:MAG TPA: hypothetical protein VFZ65_09010 [Planctomycetota bacterium]|nr:hypothetical protein [Planctomycetota bacterium]
MNTSRLLLATCLPFAGVASLAQTTVTFPSDHANHSGQYVDYNYPYSYGVSRILVLYESWDIGVAPGAAISRIGVRQHGVLTAASRSLQLEVRMGYTMRTSTDMLTNYDNNYVGTPQTVFGPALFVLPQLVNTPPGEQVVWLDLTTPFVFQPASGNLLIEWRVIANNNSNSSFNYPLDRANFYSPVTSGTSVGCQHSGGQTATLTSNPTTIGSNWVIALSSAPASSPVGIVVTVGSPLVSGYSLAPVIPGIAPACMGYLQGNLQLFGSTTNTSGYVQWSVPVPNDRLHFNDLTISSQALILDFFSPAGIVVSDGDQVQFGIDPAQTMLYSQGNVNSTTGSLWQNYGLVTLFQ